MGIIIGSISKIPESIKSAICILISMTLSIFADLMSNGIKNYIEQIIPIFNRLSPAALIVDSFYALNIYDTYDRYMRNMITLAGMSIVLLLISFVMLRRNRYESI